MKSPRHWNEARVDQPFGQGVLLSLHKLRLRSNQRGARWLLQEGVLMKGKRDLAFAKHYASIRNIMDWTWYDIRTIYIYTSQSGKSFEHLQCLNVNWYHPSLLLQWLRFQKCNHESCLITIRSISIIINYYKSTESILPAIYFPNLQQENPLYILNLFEGNVTLDIQKKCVGYNLSNSRHFHDISQVIVSHTLIHHDPSWVHQKFRTRGSPPNRNMSPGIQRLWPCEKRTSYFTKLFWSPWHVGSAFYLCRANIGRSLAPIEFASLCCFFVVEENNNFQWAFFKDTNDPYCSTKTISDLSSMCFFVYSTSPIQLGHHKFAKGLGTG